MNEKLKILADLDCIFLEAGNGQEALALLERNPDTDIILLDIEMPVMDGFETCRRLKDNPATRNIPVIFLTALTEAADEAFGLALGAVDYISKPFKPAIIKARVRNHLELKKHQEHLEEMVAARTHELARAMRETEEANRAKEEALRESEQRYKNLIENSFIGVYVGQDGSLVYLNNIAASFTGRTYGKAIG